MFLLVTEVSVLRKKDGVVGHSRLTCGQDTPNQVAHHGKNAIVHEQVIHQQLRDSVGMRPQPQQCNPLLSQAQASLKFHVDSRISPYTSMKGMCCQLGLQIGKLRLWDLPSTG